MSEGEHRPNDSEAAEQAAGAPQAEDPLVVARRMFAEQHQTAGGDAVRANAANQARRASPGSYYDADPAVQRLVNKAAKTVLKGEINTERALAEAAGRAAVQDQAALRRLEEIEHGIHERNANAGAHVADAGARTREQLADAKADIDTAEARKEAAGVRDEVHEAEWTSRVAIEGREGASATAIDTSRIAMQTQLAQRRAADMLALAEAANDVARAEDHLDYLGQRHLAEPPQSGLDRAIGGVSKVLGIGRGKPMGEQPRASSDLAAGRRSEEQIALDQTAQSNRDRKDGK